MGETGIISTGTATDLPVPINFEPIASTQAKAPAKVNKTASPAPAYASKPDPKTETYNSLVAKAQGLGIKLDFLDEQGSIKPEKLEEVKGRVAKAMDDKIKQAGEKGMKPDDSRAQAVIFVPHLLKGTEFPLLPREAQLALLKEKGYKDPEKIADAFQKDFTPHKKIAHAIRLEAQAREAKGGIEDKKDAARLYETASALDPSSLDLHKAAARNFKSWADAETVLEDKQKLYAMALAHLEPVIAANPKDVDVLKTAGAILSALGKTEEASKLYGMALQIRVDEFKHLKAEQDKMPPYHHGSQPEGARELEVRVQAAEASLKAVDEIPANTPEQKVKALECRRVYRQAVLDWKLDTYPPPYHIVQPSQEYEAYKDKLRETIKPYRAEVEKIVGEMHGLRAEAAKKANDAGLKPEERIAAARFSLDVAKVIGDNKARVEDLDLWKKTLDSFGYSDLHGAPRVQQYSDLLKEWFQFRSEITDPFVLDYPSHVLKERFYLDASEMTARMREVAPRIRESCDYMEPKDAMDRVEALLNRLIDLDDKKLLPFLTTEGLQKYAQVGHETDEKLVVAKKNLTDAKTPEDIKKARGDLLQVLASYTALRDSSKIEDLVKLVEGTLKPDTPPLHKLEAYTALSLVLKDSGFSSYESVREKGRALAGQLSSECITRLTFSESTTPVEDAQKLLLSRTFFEAVGDKDAAKAMNAGLSGLGDKIVNMLHFGDPKITDSRKRIELASLVVKVDQALLETEVAEASKADATGPKANTIQTARLGVLRAEIERAKDLPFEVKLEEFKRLSSAAATYQTLTKAIQKDQKPIIDPDTLKTETQAIGKLGDAIIDEALTPSGEVTAAQKDMAGKMAGDLKARLHQALDKGEVSWLSQLTSASITEFAMVSGKANRLLEDAKKLPPAKAEEAMALYLEAGKNFGLLGLDSRVSEAMKPVLEHTRSQPDALQRVSGYLAVSQVYQEAKMTTEANAALQELIDLKKPGCDPKIADAADIARGMQALNSGKLDEAREILKALPKNELARLLLDQIDQGQKALRLSQAVEVARVVFMSKAQSIREKGKTQEAEEYEKAVMGALDEAKRLVLTGKCKNLEDGMRRVMHDPRFYAAGLGGFLFETGPGWKTWSYMRAADDPRVTNKDFAEMSLSYARAMASDKYYGACDSIATMFLEDAYVKDQAKSLKDGLPDVVKGDGIFKTVKSLVAMNPVGLFLSITLTPKELGSDEDPVVEILKDAGIGIATFGIGKGFAVAADALYVARAASLLSRPLVYGVGRWAVRSGAEATGFVLGGMAAQTILTGRTDHWTLSHFGKEWGSMLVMFGLMHGVGMGLGRFGKYAESRGWMQSQAFRVAYKTTQYTGTIGAFTGSEYINEALGLRKKENTPLWLRILGSMATDALMRKTHKVFEGTLEAATLGKVRLSKIEMGTQATFEAQVRVKKLGFDPGASDGKLVVDALTGKLNGEQFLTEAGKRFGETVKTSLEVDPTTPEGKELASLLLFYSYKNGEKPGTPLSEAKLKESIKELDASVSSLLKNSGIEKSKESEAIRREILKLALENGTKPQEMKKFVDQAPALKKSLETIVNGLMGPGGSGTPVGQRMMRAFFVKAVTETSDPAKLTAGLEEFTAVAAETGDALRFTVNSLFGGKSTQTPQGQERLAELFFWALNVAENSGQVPKILEQLHDQAPELKSNLERSVNALLPTNKGGIKPSETAEGKKWMGEIFAAALASSKDPSQPLPIVEKVAELSQALASPPASVFELSGFTSPKERLALFQWAIENGQSPATIESLKGQIMNGEVKFVLEKDGVKRQEVPVEAREAQRQTVFDRVSLPEIPAEFIQEVYVQEIKIENLGGEKLRYVAIREGKEVGDVTVRPEKDGGIFLGFANTPKEHRNKGVFETLFADAVAGKSYVRMTVIHPETDAALQAAYKRGASEAELTKIFSESPLGKALERAGFKSHEMTRSERNGSYTVVSKTGTGKPVSAVDSPLQAAARLGLKAAGKPIQGKAAPAPAAPSSLVELQGQRSQAGLKLAEQFGLKDDPAFLKDLGRLLSGDFQAAGKLSDTKREEVVGERAREGLKLAQKYGKGEDVAFKKALAGFVVENLKAAEKLSKGSSTEVKEDTITKVMDAPPKKGPPSLPKLTAPSDLKLENALAIDVAKKEIEFLASTDTPFAAAAKKAKEGKMTVVEYRKAQKEVGVRLVETHRVPHKKVMSFLGGLESVPELKGRLPKITDESGKPVDNPQGRLKDPGDLSAKLARRGWSDLGPLTDVGGARVVVRNNADAKAVIAEIEKNFKVRELVSEEGYAETKVVGTELVGKQEVHILDVVMDRDGTQRLEIGHPERGYRALHVVVEVDGKPIEIQIQTEGMYQWGKIQHSLVYKNQSLPADSLKALEVYCRDAAQFISERENGRAVSEKPKLPPLPSTLKAAERSAIEADLEAMVGLMKKYEKPAEPELTLQGTKIPPRAGVLVGGDAPVVLEFGKTFYQIFQVQLADNRSIGLTFFGSSKPEGSADSSTIFLKPGDPVKIFRKSGSEYTEVAFSEGAQLGQGKYQFSVNDGDILKVGGKSFTFLRDPKEIRVRSEAASEAETLKGEPLKLKSHQKKMEAQGRAPDGTPLTEKAILEGKKKPQPAEDSQAMAARKGGAALKVVEPPPSEITKVERAKGAPSVVAASNYRGPDTTELAGFLYQKIIGGDQIVADGKVVGGYLSTLNVAAFGGGDISRSEAHGKYTVTCDVRTPGLGHAEELRDATVAWLKEQGAKEVQAHYIMDPVDNKSPIGIRITGNSSPKDQIVVEMSFARDALPETAQVEKARADFQKEYGMKVAEILRKAQIDMGFGSPEINDAWFAANAMALIDRTLPEVKKMEAELGDKVNRDFSDPAVVKYLKAKEQLAIYQKALEKYAALQKVPSEQPTARVELVKPSVPPPPSVEIKAGDGVETKATKPLKTPVDREETTSPGGPGARDRKKAREEPLVFRIGDGEAPGLIALSNEVTPVWRVKEVSSDGKALVLENTENPSFTVNATAPKKHTFKVGQAVMTMGIGGGGKAMPWLKAQELAQVAKALIAQHEFENSAKQGDGTYGYSATQDSAPIKAARAYVAAVESGKTPPADKSFLDSVKDYHYRVSLGLLVPAEGLKKDGKLSAHNEKWKFTVVAVDAKGITVENGKGEKRVLEGLPAARGAQEKMPHLFRVGDEVVLIPRVAGGAPMPGEGPGAAFSVSYQETAPGQYAVELGRKAQPELSTASGISDRHARLRFDQSKQTFTLEDMGSEKGTFVYENGNWVSIKKGEQRLLQYDQVFSLGTEQYFRVGKDFLIHPYERAPEAPAETGPLPYDGAIRTISPDRADKNFVVGSSQGDLMFYDPAVSGVHLTLEPRGSEGWFLHDGMIGVPKKSGNGVWLNGVRIREKTVPIKEGDLIEIRGVKNGQQVMNSFRFRPPQAPAPAVGEPMAAKKSAASTVDPTKAQWKSAPMPFAPDPADASSQVVILGRGTAKGNPQNLFQIPSSEVSRSHAQIRKASDGYYLTDLGSQNGTWIKEKGGFWVLLEKGNEVRLEVGQEFALGRVSEKGETTDAVVMNVGKDGRLYTQSEMVDLPRQISKLPPAQVIGPKSGPWETELKAGDVDMAKPPVVKGDATPKMGSFAAVTTQGVKDKANEDGILQVRGPKGELYLFDADGMGGQGNGAVAAKLTLEAFRDEIQRSGDPEKAFKFANAVVSRFNGSMWVVNGYDPAVKFNTAVEAKVAMEKISKSTPDQVAWAEAEARKALADPELAAFDKGPMAGGAGAVAVNMTVQPPARPGDPHTVHFHWVGDARGVIFERGNDGKWHWVYRTVDESAVGNPELAARDSAFAFEPGVHYHAGGRGKTLMMMVNPKANVVLNGVGLGRENLEVKKTENGELPNPADPTGSSPASSMKNGIAIKKGQLALLGSDGLWENFGHTALIEALIQNCKTSDDVVKVLTDETHFRMEVLRQAKDGELSGVPGPGGTTRFKFERPEGILYGVLVQKTYRDNQGKEQSYIDVEIRKATTLFIDTKGKVYEKPGDTSEVDHYKTDNLSLMAYLHNPKETAGVQAVAPSKSKGPPPVPQKSKVEDPGKAPSKPKAVPPPLPKAASKKDPVDLSGEAVLEPSTEPINPNIRTLPLAALGPFEPFVIGKADPKGGIGIKVDDPTLSEVHVSLRKNRFGELYVYNGSIGGKPSVTGITIRRHSSEGGTDIKVKDVMQVEPGDLLVIPILGGQKVYALDPTGEKYLPKAAFKPEAAQIGSVEGTLFGSSDQKTSVGAVELGLLTEGGTTKTVNILFGTKAPGLWVSEGESQNFSGLSLFEVWKERGSYIIKFKEDAFTEGKGKVEILGNGNTKPPSRLDPQRLLREGGEYTIKIADHTIKIKLPPTEEAPPIPMAAKKTGITAPRKIPPPGGNLPKDPNSKK